MAKRKTFKETTLHNSKVLIDFTLEGRTPLLMDRFTAAARDALLKKSTSVHKGEPPTPREAATEALYMDDDNRPAFPNHCMFEGLMAAGKYHKIGTSKVTTRDTSMIPTALHITTFDCPVLTKNGGPDWGHFSALDPQHTIWEVFESKAHNRKLDVPVIKFRPKFDQWRVAIQLELDTQILSLDLMRRIVDDFGNKIGVGSWRPECKGQYGRARVVAWEVEEAPV
jgi:hypothetical protein